MIDLDLQQSLTAALDLIASTDPVLRPLAEFRRQAMYAAALRQRMHYDRANAVLRGAHQQVWQHLLARHSQPRVRKHSHRIFRILRRAQDKEGA